MVLVVTTAPSSLGRQYSQEVTADSSGYQHGDDHPVTAERKRQPWYTGAEIHSEEGLQDEA